MSLSALILSIGAILFGDYTPLDRSCATAAVYGEARGESELGQAMVAKVILNRVADKRWPGSVCAVVAQHRQFAGYHAVTPGAQSTVAWRNAENIVDAVLAGQFSPGSCGRATHFHASWAYPAWATSRRMKRLCRIDSHIFYLEIPHGRTP